MNSDNFDYETYFSGLDKPETQSNQTISSPSTETDSDIGTGQTPSMTLAIDDTVIDLDTLDFWPLNVDVSLPDEEFSRFLFDEKNSPLHGDQSTYENLFSQSNKNELITNKPKIKIISANKPLLPTNISKIQMSVTKVDPPGVFSSSSAKRRRSNSPINDQDTKSSTLTLDQLRLQYKHLNDEALKKHLRMIKNRESASLSRKRRKELMENLDVRVKELTEENEQLKKRNNQLLTQVQTLQIENELLKKYPQAQIKKPLILMGVVLLVVFNVFTLQSLTPSTNLSNIKSLDLYNNEKSIVPGRTLLSHSNKNLIKDEKSLITSNGYDDNKIPSYPYIQCVAYINKTHSRRINQDLHSLTEEHQSNVIPDGKSLQLSSKHSPRKGFSQSKNQLQPYKSFQTHYNDFVRTIERKNDTIYFVTFKRDHLIIPAAIQNQTERPKMSIILPASIANLNKSINVPSNHVPMIKIDCQVDDTKLIFVKHSDVPSAFRQDLFQYYSSSI